MYTGFLHLHTLVVVLYLIIFGTKSFLLLANKHSRLEKIRAKTKILEMVLGGLFVITGVALIFLSAESGQIWLWIKLVLVLLIIPLGIIAFKRKNKLMAVLGLLIFLYSYGISETKSLTFKRNLESYGTQVTDIKAIEKLSGKMLYSSYCTDCHGANGDLGLSGAANLMVSELNEEEIHSIISNGRKKMPAYKEVLNNEQIDELSRYVLSLKK